MVFSSTDSALIVSSPALGGSSPVGFVMGSSSICITPGHSSKLITNESHKEAGCVDDGTSLPSLGSSAEEPSAVPAATSKFCAESRFSKRVSKSASTITSKEMYHIMYHAGAEEGVALYDKEVGSGVVGGSTLKGPLEATFPCLPNMTSCHASLKEAYQAVYHDEAQQWLSPQLSSQNFGRQSEPLRHGNLVMEVSWWDFPVDDQGRETMKKLDYVKSQVLNGMDVCYSMLQAQPATHKKRRRIERWSSRKAVSVESSANDPSRQRLASPLVRDVSFDPRFLQYDESPYGYLDQLVRLPGNIPPNSIPRIDSTLLRSVPEGAANIRGSRVGPGYQARVPRRKDKYHDKRNAVYLPK